MGPAQARAQFALKAILASLSLGIGLAHAQERGATGTPAPATIPTAPGQAGRGGRGAGPGGGFGRGPVEPPGPPAPVPPEVAMPRPTAEEVARINADLKQFVETKASPDGDLLRKYASLITVPLPRDNPCIRPARSARGNRHNALVQRANAGDFDIMFIGDSITDLLGADRDPFGNTGGKAAMDKHFADVKVANFGVSGDTTQGVLWGFQNGEGQGHKPRAIMLMIGTNNAGGASGPEIAEGIGADILELRKDFPDAKILLLAIFPRGAGPADANRITTEEANRIIARLHDGRHVFFMNINDKFLEPQGKLIGFRPSDNLHPVEQGFDIWLSSVADTLKGWIK
jgi:beta-glucosidase